MFFKFNASLLINIIASMASTELLIAILISAWPSLSYSAEGPLAPLNNNDLQIEQDLDHREVYPIKDPDFLLKGSSLQSQTIYFGFGFRSVSLNFNQGSKVTQVIKTDPSKNGIAFHIGYLWEENTIEYARHVSIFKPTNTLTYKNISYTQIEVTQNNLWYFYTPHITQNLYATIGLGLQQAEIRKMSADAPNFEGSVIIGAGLSWYLTNNFLLQYRYTHSNYSSFLTSNQEDSFLKETFFHVLYLDYSFEV